eukprot:g18318.t1
MKAIKDSSAKQARASHSKTNVFAWMRCLVLNATCAKSRYVRTCLQSSTRFSSAKVQSFVPVGQKPEQPVKLRSVKTRELDEIPENERPAHGFDGAAGGVPLSSGDQGAAGEAYGSTSSSRAGSGGKAVVLPSPGSAGGSGLAEPTAHTPTEGAGAGGAPLLSSDSAAGATSSSSSADAAAQRSQNESAEPLFRPNDLIVIHGLKSEKASGFNGREGVILGYIPETKKYDALIDGKTRIMVKGDNLKAKPGMRESARLIYDAWMYPFVRRPVSSQLVWNSNLRGTFADVNGSVLSRAASYQNSAQGAGKNFARAIKGLLSLDNPDGVVGVTSTPIPRHGQGYFVEVEVLEVARAEESVVGCLGLGVSFLKPETQIEKIPRRLEKIEQGWFFSGPYYGQTRRLYKDGQKDIRYILDGEDSAPIKWKVGDRMSVLVRPKDSTKAEWIWTISMYANRDIVMACHMDLHPWLPQGSPIPKELDMYAFCEAFGYVQKVKLCNDATPTGLEIPFKPKALKEMPQSGLPPSIPEAGGGAEGGDGAATNSEATNCSGTTEGDKAGGEKTD